MINIQKKRKLAGLTQQALAEKLKEKGFNIDRSTVAKWETDKAYPRIEKLLALAEIFDCPVNELLSA